MTSKSKPSNKYNDQHILMAALPFILLNAKEYFKKPPNFYIRTDNTSFISTPALRCDMPREKDLASLLKINNIDLASIVPKVEFFKIVKEQKTGKIKKEIYIPYAYDARNYIENIYGNRQQRGDDVGIKNVTFVYDEQNPAVAESLLGCTVDFVFANAEALVTKRNAGFQFADLFSFADTKSNEIVDRDQYDIVLKVGYQLDGTIPTMSGEIREALKKQERMIKLGMVDYSLSFNPNGMLNVSVQYKSSNVNFFSAKKNEIFGAKKLTSGSKEKSATVAEPEPSSTAQQKVIEDALDMPADELPPEVIDPAVDLQALYSRIQTYMAENCMIHKFDASLVDMIAEGDYYFSKNPCQASGLKNDFKEESSGHLLQAGATNVEEVLLRFAEQEYEGKRTITYFYFGDLLEAVLATNPEIVGEMQARRFAFLLDNVAYQFLKGTQISVFNIAKLPIAQSVFNQWFSKNILGKEKKIVSLLSFVKTYILNFALGLMRMRTQDQIGSDYSPNIVRRLISIPNGLSDNKTIGGFTSFEPVVGKSFYGKKAADSYYEYYAIYDESYYNDRLSTQMDNVSEADRYYFNLVEGIPHFYIGADKGLLKEFSFEKSNLGEEISVIRNLEPGNPYQELWSIFDINATFIGNNLMTVGKNIYLDPSITGLGSPLKKGTVANRMGLGGYYMVTRVEHRYLPKWTTTITAMVVTPASQQTYTSRQSLFRYF